MILMIIHKIGFDIQFLVFCILKLFKCLLSIAHVTAKYGNKYSILPQQFWLFDNLILGIPEICENSKGLQGINHKGIFSANDKNIYHLSKNDDHERECRPVYHSSEGSDYHE